MPKKKFETYLNEAMTNTRPCHVPGCEFPGEHKAPKSKDSLHDYDWYCLEHIREYNKKWDYFSGMDNEEIEHFMKDAVTGHRPTWGRESHIKKHYEQLQHAIYEFLNSGSKRKETPNPELPPKLRQALAVLDLQYPIDAKTMKSQYRALVKRYHPDVNKGDKQAEEKFKQVTSAYLLLREHIKNM